MPIGTITPTMRLHNFIKSAYDKNFQNRISSMKNRWPEFTIAALSCISSFRAAAGHVLPGAATRLFHTNLAVMRVILGLVSSLKSIIVYSVTVSSFTGLRISRPSIVLTRTTKFLSYASQVGDVSGMRRISTATRMRVSSSAQGLGGDPLLHPRWLIRRHLPFLVPENSCPEESPETTGSLAIKSSSTAPGATNPVYS